MASLAERYTRLKRRVGGNREKMGYEETFGLPLEEQYHVTPLNPWQRRILSELGFALSLSEEAGGRFDREISNALEILEEKIAAQGALTNADCQKAEQALLPLAAEAKTYSLILAAHAHIDMNWLWGWQETVAATLATFHTMLDLMDEYPDFCFSQSQASVYKIVEDYDPEMMPRIQQRIREGRWEITATSWVETDKNMPNTESLLRHIKVTRDYLKNHWNIDPASLEIDFSPDTFGHSANIPEIDSFGGVKYCYHCRGLDGDNALYRWRSPSGKELLMYREQHWYNSAITPHIALNLVDISKKSGGLKTGLIVYGVGDHGGGATRRDVERGLEMMDWPIFPKIRFGTMREFFKEAESVRDRLPLVDHEINYVAPGCYTTQSRIKLGNRKCEKALYEADLFTSLAHANLGTPYRKNQFEHAWQNVLFTHFHDILTGSCVQESREYAMGLLSDSMAVANTQHNNALRAISNQIDTSSIETDGLVRDSQSEGAGVGYGLTAYAGVPNPERGSGKTRIFHVFNSQPHTRSEVVELTVWDWPGDLRQISVRDVHGEELEYALIDHQMQDYWAHKYFRVLVCATVPALGYTTLTLRETECSHYRHYLNNPVRSDHPYGPIVLENAHIRAEFHPHNGNLVSLTDKQSGKEMIQNGSSAALQFIHTESATSSAWQIGRYTHAEEITDTTRIYPFANGSLRTGFVVEKKIRNSTIHQTVSLDRDAKALRFQLDVDWNEAGSAEFVPVLAYTFPHAYEAESYRFDIPGGSQTRPAQYLDVPGLQYGAAVNPDGNSVVLIADSKYGYRGVDGTLTLTLINSTTSPDKYPERGIHKINFALGLETDCPKALEELASDVNYPLHFISDGSHTGTLPQETELLRFEAETAVLSGVTTADNGDLLVRFYETCGKACQVKLETLLPVKSAQSVDLMERNCVQAETDGNTVTLTVQPYCIGEVRIGH